jgi:hypothetical protein
MNRIRISSALGVIVMLSLVTTLVLYIQQHTGYGAIPGHYGSYAQSTESGNNRAANSIAE